MLETTFARQKALSILQQIAQLQHAEFPYAEPKTALVQLHELFSADVERLERAKGSANADIRHQACAQVNANINRYHPVVGFLLRATNTRNSFELYDPLLRMCKQLCGEEAKLVLSSEWEFSPFTYPAVFEELPDLIFIGLPASEASNALILPLAGHELGHSVWRIPRHSKSVQEPLRKMVLAALEATYAANWAEFSGLYEGIPPASEFSSDLLLREKWIPSYRSALKQAEELFCDAIGISLFGQSYLYAFAYVISPNFGGRSTNYPPLSIRVSLLQKFCLLFDIDWPNGYSDLFLESPVQGLSKTDEFRLRMADNAIEGMIDDIIQSAQSHASSSGVIVFDEVRRADLVTEFSLLCPGRVELSLADIVNAGWTVALDSSIWSNLNLDEDARKRVLNDILLKTIEVMEYNHRMGAPDA